MACGLSVPSEVILLEMARRNRSLALLLSCGLSARLQREGSVG